MSATTKDSIKLVIAIITLLISVLGVVVPTFEEAFKVTILEYLIPLISGIIVIVTLVVVLEKLLEDE